MTSDNERLADELGAVSGRCSIERDRETIIQAAKALRRAAETAVSIYPINSVGMRGALKQSEISHASMIPSAVTSALADVAAERKRQREVEGWTPEHDDEHGDGTMAAAAAAYVFATDCGVAHTVDGEEYLVDGRELWPWDWKWWKPKDRRRNLVRAGALIVAEIERLDRRALLAKSKMEAR